MSRRRQKKRLPAEPSVGVIEGLGHDGRGIARIEGKTTFIQGALPGETVSFRYTSQRSKVDEGYAESVITAAPERVTPGCAHFAICGGCSMQHMSTEHQITHKQGVLSELLAHQAQVAPTKWLAPLTASAWGYRHKARMSVRYVNKKDSALVGFRERLMGRFIADIERCEVLHPLIGNNIKALRELIASLDAQSEIAQIEVAMGEDEGGLIFRNMVELSPADIQSLKDFGKRHGLKIYLQPKGPKTVHLIHPEGESEFLSYRLKEFDLNLTFHPTDFTQVNPAMNAKMVSLAMQLLAPTKTDRILDLFCGLGNFSLAIARLAGFVIGVEGSEEMVERASLNAKNNGIENADFFAADLTEPFENQPWAQGVFDKLLIDPPRSGAYEIVKQIEHFNVDTIVYVSCDPATLARDTGVLVNEKGYELVAAGVMDMFPHTKHVESIALFKRP